MESELHSHDRSWMCGVGNGCPLTLLVVAVYSEILFQCLVGAFGLSITFRVISRSEVKSHVESFSERSEEVQDKLRSAVGCDM